MARIRSVHPGLFTDEDFVSLSDAAQIFFIGLWTEADDFGAFEWKPITLKMKLRPATSAPVDPLLDELEAAGRVKRYTINRRSFGLIRNFCKYQRPKFPKSAHTIPDDLRDFVGLSPPITVIDRDDRPPITPKSEKPPQMEDGEEDEGVEEKIPSPKLREPYAFDGRVIRLSQRDFAEWSKTFHGYPDLRAELVAIDTKLFEAHHKGDWFGKVSGWLRSGHVRLLETRVPPQTPEDEAVIWRAALKAWTNGGRKPSAWPDGKGQPPGRAGCQVPEHLLREFNIPIAA